MFVPRLEAPSYTDPNWIMQSAGGKNPCIRGWNAVGGSVLANCFSGDTEIITRQGIVRLDSIVGQNVDVLTDDGTYHTAIGIYGGKQPVYKLTFNNNSEFICTATHEWSVITESRWNGKHYVKKKTVKSLDLNTYHNIPYVQVSDTEVDFHGIQNGFIYGDGTLYNSGTQSKASLCGFKREYMKKYFEDALHISSWGEVDDYYPYPKHYKFIPDLSEDISYLRGFICGLLASDGTVDDSGCPSISTAKKVDFLKICEILSVLGYRYHTGKTIHDTNFKKGAELYRIYIAKNSITSNMFLNPIHYDKFTKKSKNSKYTRIKSIEPLDLEVDVYCVTEPITHTFALSNGMITRNCTGYVVGRSLELFGDDAYSLPWQYNAGEYYPNLNENGVWKRNSKPTLGSIGCYLSTVGSWGHVLVVEQVNADGSIVTSESAWQGKRWYSQTLRPPFYTWNNSFKLQGFIYNVNGPKASSSKIEDFISKAKSCIGKKAKDLNLSEDKYCSAEFIIYCAKAVNDVLGTVIPDKPNSADFANTGIRKGMGSYIKGPLNGVKSSVKPGDIVLIRIDSKKRYSNQYACDQLYLVTDTAESKLTVVGTENTGIVVRRELSNTSNLIWGYYRPKWSLVDNSTDYMIGYAPLGKFYDTENTSEDATVREVAYLNGANKPTINKSSVKLSVVNYTTMLDSVLSNLLVPSVYSGNINEEAILDGVDNQKARECIQFLMNKGLNAAAACGICGNIEAESVPPYNTASVGDFGTSFGICQWHYGRGDAMKRMAGSNWANNLTGQLEYLWYELQNAYRNSTLIPIQAVPNTEQGARRAADIFVRNFEIPAYVDEQSVIRQNNASKLYNKVVVLLTTTSKTSSSVIPGSKPFTGKTIEIPSSERQAGIDTTYTNYLWFYNQWGSSTYQCKVANLWNAKGRKSNRRIATIDGLYLIALKTTFGISGDKVSVILEDGTVINCIIADSKGWENPNIYGHDTYGRGLNVVEWEADDGTASSNYVTNPPDISGWKGKKVKKIINGGSIL